MLEIILKMSTIDNNPISKGRWIGRIMWSRLLLVLVGTLLFWIERDSDKSDNRMVQKYTPISLHIGFLTNFMIGWLPDLVCTLLMHQLFRPINRLWTLVATILGLMCLTLQIFDFLPEALKTLIQHGSDKSRLEHALVLFLLDFQETSGMLQRYLTAFQYLSLGFVVRSCQFMGHPIDAALIGDGLFLAGIGRIAANLFLVFPKHYELAFIAIGSIGDIGFWKFFMFNDIDLHAFKKQTISRL